MSRLTLDYVWDRFRARIEGLTDDELQWRPAPTDPDLSIAWRLAHIAHLLGEQRNRPWLGREVDGIEIPHVEATTAAEAIAAVERSWAAWKSLADSLTDEELAEPIGPVGGFFADHDRESFVLHIADELIHHAAEVGILRDLYAATVRP